MREETDQEAFWRGTFGGEYSDRNRGSGWIAANRALFAQILKRTSAVDSILELGSNIGLNRMALRVLLPQASLAPVEITYRGETGKLFKRDFAGEILDRFPDLALIDYGFAYRRDPNFPQDDLSWFLMEKQASSQVATPRRK